MATTILWSGGEDIDFLNVGAVTYDQTAGHFDATKARGAIQVPSSGGVTSSAIANAVAFTAASTLWLHTNAYVGGTFTNNNTVMALTDASGVERFQVAMLNGNGGATQVSLLKQDGSGHSTTLITGSLQIAAVVLEPFDIAVTMASAGGSFAFYQNNTLLASFSGNTLTDNQTTLTGFLLGSIPSNGVPGTYYSEVIAATGDTRSMRLNTTIASGLGNTNTWTVNGGSSAWQTVSQWTTSNNINIAVATSSQLAEFTTSTLVSGAWSVLAVVTSAYALAGTSGGPQHLAHVIRTAATDYSGASLPLLPSLQNSKVVWSANPSTGNNWQQSDITNPGFNFGVVSEP